MARIPDKRVERAKELYLSGKKLVEIAEILGVPEGTVRSWKNRYQWGSATLQKDVRNVAKKRGGQPNNKNAKGCGGIGPPENKNAEKHGFFTKYLPKETTDIIQQMSTNPLDLLWDQIQIAYAAILRSQKIMYVRNREDLTTTQIQRKEGDNIQEERWEVQQAWDKQAVFLKAQARAQAELRALIKRYDEMLHKNWELAAEEQKTRIALLKNQMDSEKEIPIQITFKKASEKKEGELDGS